MEADPVDVFRQEAAELLDSLEATLLDLAQRPQDRALIDTAFRALHTIKGSGGMFGFDRVAAFTHDFETAFDRLRKGEIAPDAEIVSVALAAKDHIRGLIEHPQATDAIIGDGILDDLRRFTAPPGSSLVGPAPAVLDVAAPAGWTLRVAFAPDTMRNGINPLALLDDLRALGPCRLMPDLAQVPALDGLDPLACLIAWDVVIQVGCARTDIEDVFLFVRDEMTLEIVPLPAEGALLPSSPSCAEPAAAAAPAAAPQPSEPQAPRRRDDGSATVRVQARRLDELMDRVGELVIAQARLSQLADDGPDPAIKAVAEEIERLAAGLRDTATGVRMVPVASLFGRFRRLVHDLSRDLGKPITLLTAGEDTELDKTMIERLADPLVHLIRNAADHGIEAPPVRAGSAKDATGHIELSARYVGTEVEVTVRDDGAGLNTARIRAKAEEQGLLAPGAPVSDHEVHQLLFHPGLSTAATVSTLSGRGVGMDVVKRVIEGMRGSIELSTRPGQGSTVTLRLPLTLAIIEGLLLRVGGGRYVIPLSTVEECIEMPAAGGGPRNLGFVNLRGEMIPLLSLGTLFGADAAAEPHRKVIITAAGEMRVGLVVDQIIGSHQAVIKALSRLHADVTMFSGATILGDGTAALILDVVQLAALGQSHGGPCLAEAA